MQLWIPFRPKLFQALISKLRKLCVTVRIKHVFIFDTVLFDCLISEDEEEDFSKGAEDFVEAVKKRRTERQSDNGNIRLSIVFP